MCVWGGGGVRALWSGSSRVRMRALNDPYSELVSKFLSHPTFTRYTTICATRPTHLKREDVSQRLYDALTERQDSTTPVEDTTTRLQILDQEHRDEELRKCLENIDEEMLTDDMLHVVLRLATRNDGRNTNQRWIIQTAQAYVTEEIIFCASVMEDMFFQYEYQTRSFAEWRAEGFEVSIEDTLESKESSFLTLIADSFFYSADGEPHHPRELFLLTPLL
jgi:hypothetical protein